MTTLERKFGAHNPCNLKYKKGLIIPIGFHNLTGYDSHAIMKILGKTHRISLLQGKYISFTNSIAKLI